MPQPVTLTFFAGQHLYFTLSPIPAVPQIAAFTIKADGLQAEMDWAPTTGMKWNAGVTNFSVMSGTTVVALPKLQFPPAAGFDFAHPDTNRRWPGNSARRLRDADPADDRARVI